MLKSLIIFSAPIFTQADIQAFRSNAQTNSTSTRYQAPLAAFGMQIKEDQAVPGYLIIGQDLDQPDRKPSVKSKIPDGLSDQATMAPLTDRELKDLEAFREMERRQDLLYNTQPRVKRSASGSGNLKLGLGDLDRLKEFGYYRFKSYDEEIDATNACQPLKPKPHLDQLWDSANAFRETVPVFADMDDYFYMSDNRSNQKRSVARAFGEAPNVDFVHVSSDFKNRIVSEEAAEAKAGANAEADAETADSANQQGLPKFIQRLPTSPVDFFISNSPNKRKKFITTLWNWFTEFRTGKQNDDAEFKREVQRDPLHADFALTDFPSFEQLETDPEDADRVPANANGERLFLGPSPQPVMLTNIKNVFVMVKRGNCSFATKVFNAQQAGYDGVVVYDPDTDYTISMHADPRTDGIDPNSIVIPSVFVGRTISRILYENFLFNPDVDKKDLEKQPFLMMVSDDNSIIDYLLPLSLILIVCLITMMMFSCLRIIRNWRDNRKNRLARRKLKKLPRKIFKKEDMKDDWETCAICLEDYEDGDKLRILPCNHAYHTDCIDPWLTRNRRNCPLCKRNVLSDDDSDGQTNATDIEISVSSSTSSEDEDERLVDASGSEPTGTDHDRLSTSAVQSEEQVSELETTTSDSRTSLLGNSMSSRSRSRRSRVRRSTRRVECADLLPEESEDSQDEQILDVDQVVEQSLAQNNELGSLTVHDGSTNVPEEIEMASGDPGTQPENKEEHRITTVTASSSDSSTSIASIQSSSVDETVIEIPASDEE